jgi:hypothetical protein
MNREMREEFYISTTVPHNAPCVQLGSANYHEWSTLECNALRDQIHRQLGAPPIGARIKTVRLSHDFGTYLDLVVIYTPEDKEAEEWVRRVEEELPEEWDEEAKRYLKNNGYPVDEPNESLR